MSDWRENPKKITKSKIIHSKHKNEYFTWKDIKEFSFEDDDIIEIEYVPSSYSDNNSWNDFFRFEVTRQVLETDYECKKRLEGAERRSKELKEKRYETYLKLKQEFESEQEASKG